MKLWLTALILTFGCFLPSFGEESEARVLVSKNILNQYIVEGKDLTVEYKIYNVGGRVVYGVVLSEIGFPDSSFSIIRGSLRVSWERIAPMTNITHAVILKPLKSGYYNFTAAEVSYFVSEEYNDRTFVYSSFPGQGGIIAQKDFDRKFSPQVLDWLVFAFMTLPSLGIPFMLWYRSKTRYDDESHVKSS